MIAYVREDEDEAHCTFIAGVICWNGGANVLVNRHGLYMLVRDEFAINLRLIITRGSNVIESENGDIDTAFRLQIKLLRLIEFYN